MSTNLDLCLRLFPYVICLETTGRISFVSDRLADRLGSSIIEQTLEEAFSILNPAPNALDCSTIGNAHVGKLFLMHTHDKQFALRGQIVDGELHGRALYFFVGAPWSSWLYENGKRLSLNANEFPIQDSQLEHQMYLTTQNIMRADLEELSEELTGARVKAETASKAKTEFVKHISHEIRTPLNGVITSLALLSDPAQKLRCDRLLDIASSSAKALMDLVDGVLDFSRIEEGATAIVRTEVDLLTFARDMEAAFSARAVERNMRMRFLLANNLPSYVSCDRRSLQKVCFNLISNAIKYSKSEQLDVSFDVMDRPSNGPDQHVLVFECRDYGVGIAEENQALIFEAFWTAPEVKISSEQSSGLGLAITSELVSLLEGTLTLESTPGEGASFVVTVPIEVLENPLNDADARPALQNERSTTAAEQQFTGRALIVDDNAINLELGHILLQRLGLDVEIARDGREAVERVMSEVYDIVFMDINMPIMGGIEATQAILSNESTANTVIIALTANASSDDIASYKNAGMLDTLVKPIEQRALHALCSVYLEPQTAPKTISASSVVAPIHERDTMNTETALLDASKLQQLKDDIGAANFERIAVLFLDETRSRVTELSTLLLAGERDEIAAAAHRLASSCLAFGLMRLGETLRQAETEAKGEADLALTTPVLETLCAASLDALESHMA